MAAIAEWPSGPQAWRAGARRRIRHGTAKEFKEFRVGRVRELQDIFNRNPLEYLT
jgi:hypothetical protein